LRGERYDLHNATLLDLIALAYSIEPDTVVGGPIWLELDRFDMAAKAPRGTSQANVRLMLRFLLADRFKLVVHNDQRPLPGFALTLAKGNHKLKESSADPPKGCQDVPGPSTSNGTPFNAVVCQGVTMERFAALLRNYANTDLTGPVVDVTGLKGNWDFELKWTGRSGMTRAGSEGISIYDAIQSQLGLALESRNVPMPVLVIDSVERKPTPNPPGTDEKLPALPSTKFELSTVRPSAPNTTPSSPRMNAGQLVIRAAPLSQMIEFGWDLLNSSFIADPPSFLSSVRYDFTAKAFSENGANLVVDNDDLRRMVQALVQERFNLKVHFEPRDVQTYTLRVDKSKLKPADPANRASCKEAPLPGAKDPRLATPVRNRLLTCLNSTVAEFAENLQAHAYGYFNAPVSDSTGLEGRYDISVSFSGNNLVRDATAPSNAAEPSAVISLFDAVNSQLGLKVEKQLKKMPVLVIDHIDERPSEN
jgi:uncharacterized protein (TIGR03435 family)